MHAGNPRTAPTPAAGAEQGETSAATNPNSKSAVNSVLLSGMHARKKYPEVGRQV